jgi:hypothetical protein
VAGAYIADQHILPEFSGRAWDVITSGIGLAEIDWLVLEMINLCPRQCTEREPHYQQRRKKKKWVFRVCCA